MGAWEAELCWLDWNPGDGALCLVGASKYIKYWGHQSHQHVDPAGMADLFFSLTIFPDFDQASPATATVTPRPALCPVPNSTSRRRLWYYPSSTPFEGTAAAPGNAPPRGSSSAARNGEPRRPCSRISQTMTAVCPMAPTFFRWLDVRNSYPTCQCAARDAPVGIGVGGQDWRR